jgi:UDPglucose 6-dehydrogenase
VKISVFGTGYVGLVTGVCFAELGNEVTCVDIDPEKIENLKSGISPIYEPGLEDLILSNIRSERLFFTTDSKKAIQEAGVLFIAVGTPSDVDGSADLRYVLKVAETLASEMNEDKVIVTKSTVPVGTHHKIRNVIAEKLAQIGVNFKFHMVSNPEFLREGNAVEDCLKPARIVVGVDSEKGEKIMRRLYEPFTEAESPLVVMDLASAEMTKYAANAMLATRISLMNEFSRVCNKVGADIEMVRKGIGGDPRIGSQFINAGVGYGGSCFPKDVRALIHIGRESDEELHILKAVEKTNSLQRSNFITHIRQTLGGFQGKKIALWGVAFKPGTDDIREAPSLDVIEAILQDGGSVCAYDPVASENAQSLFSDSNLSFEENQYAVLNLADALVIVTEWKSFREPDFAKMKERMKASTIFDGRNIYSHAEMKELGFKYYSVGRTT